MTQNKGKPSSLRKRRRTEGFSLVEVVIALAILTIALCGCIATITYTSRMNQSARERMLAMRAAERKIEEMLSLGDFTEIYNKYFLQQEGVGWEVVDGLEPVDPAPLPPPNDQKAYVYPSWTNKAAPPPRRAVLFVRFPLSDDGTSFCEGPDGNYPGSGVFTNSYVVDPVTGRDPVNPITKLANKRVFVDMDFNGDGNKTSRILTSDIKTMKILPVTIEVHWRGIVGGGALGDTSLTYRYIFFKDPLK